MIKTAHHTYPSVVEQLEAENRRLNALVDELREQNHKLLCEGGADRACAMRLQRENWKLRREVLALALSCAISLALIISGVLR